MTGSVDIGFVARGEAEALAALHRSGFDVAWSAAAIDSLLDATGAFALAAGNPGDRRGFVLCGSAADEVEVLSCVVAPDHRRRGLGDALLRAALDEAVRRGARRVFLEVGEGNTAARALYRRSGFQPVGRRRRYYRTLQGVEDALILARALDVPATITTG